MVITTMTGMDPGQVISITGEMNVEAVPGAELRIDIKAEDQHQDGTDIEAARNLRAILRRHSGYDFISSVDRYKEILKLVETEKLYKREVINRAFIGSILPMLGRAAEGVMKYAPMVLEGSKMLHSAIPPGRIVNRAKMESKSCARNCAMITDGEKVVEKDDDSEPRNFAMMGNKNFVATLMAKTKKEKPRDTPRPTAYDFGPHFTRYDVALQEVAALRARLVEVETEMLQILRKQVANERELLALQKEEEDKADETASTTPTLPNGNYAMMSFPASGRGVGGPVERVVVHAPEKIEEEEEQNIPFETQTQALATDQFYSGYRHFPVIEARDGEYTAIPARVHVSKTQFTQEDFSGQATTLQLKDKTISIMIEGLVAKLQDKYTSDDLNSNSEEIPTEVNRLLNFIARFCIHEEDKEIFIIFQADNELPIQDFSFAAALESMLFGMDPKIVCTGDSAPNMDFLVPQNMSTEMIEKKLEAFQSSSYYIKADTTTTSRIELPEGVKNISADYVKLVGLKTMPLHFSAENPLPLMHLYP